MKRPVTLVRPKREYKAPLLDKEKAAGNGRVNYPSIEGVIINPPPKPDRSEERKSVTELLGLILMLPQQEQKQLLAQLALSLQSSTKHLDRDLEMWSVAVHGALVQLIGREGGDVQGPALVKRVVGASASWSAVQAFMKDAKLDQIAVTERQSVYMMLAELLAKHALEIARRAQVPLSAKFMANCASNIASIFDNSFPGYLASGLAPLVARRLTGARAPD